MHRSHVHRHIHLPFDFFHFWHFSKASFSAQTWTVRLDGGLWLENHREHFTVCFGINIRPEKSAAFLHPIDTENMPHAVLGSIHASNAQMQLYTVHIFLLLAWQHKLYPRLSVSWLCGNADLSMLSITAVKTLLLGRNNQWKQEELSWAVRQTVGEENAGGRSSDKTHRRDVEKCFEEKMPDTLFCKTLVLKCVLTAVFESVFG